MTALDAAKQVLEEAGEPLHFKEVTQRILDKGYWSTNGKTPWATINAQMSVEIQQKGPSSRFQRTRPGHYALRAWGLPEFVPKQKKSGKSREKKGNRRPLQTMSFTDAAEEVLKRFSGRKPMHYRDITAKALEIGLVQTRGKTPEASLNAQVGNEIGRAAQRGETPRFIKHGKGYYGLSRWLGKGLAREIKRHNQDVRRKLHQRLLKMDPSEFEVLISELLIELGFEEVNVTNYQSDRGIDVRGTLVVGDVVRTRMAIQVKRWKLGNNVRSPTVQQVRGSLSTHEQGLIITTSDYSNGARQEAAQSNKTPVALMNGDQLVSLLVEHDIGITRTPHYILELEEDVEE